jgi:hypothetical protein
VAPVSATFVWSLCLDPRCSASRTRLHCFMHPLKRENPAAGATGLKSTDDADFREDEKPEVSQSKVSPPKRVYGEMQYKLLPPMREKC